MDQVNDFLKKHGVADFELSRSLRQYVIHNKAAYRDETTRDLLEKLPPSLGGECAKIASKVLLQTKIYWFHKIADTVPAMVLEVVLRMQTHIHAPREVVVRPFTLFVMHKGVCARNG